MMGTDRRRWGPSGFNPTGVGGMARVWKAAAEQGPGGRMFDKLTLRMKLALGFGTLILFIAALSLVGYYTVSRLDDAAGLATTAAEKRKLARQIETAVKTTIIGTRGFLL